MERNWNKNLKSQELCDFIATKLEENPSDIFIVRVYNNSGVYGDNGCLALCFKDIPTLETILESLNTAFEMGAVSRYTTICIKSYENYGTVAEYNEDLWNNSGEYLWEFSKGKRL
jgi:hypothetical protein